MVVWDEFFFFGGMGSVVGLVLLFCYFVKFLERKVVSDGEREYEYVEFFFF